MYIRIYTTMKYIKTFENYINRKDLEVVEEDLIGSTEHNTNIEIFDSVGAVNKKEREKKGDIKIRKMPSSNI